MKLYLNDKVYEVPLHTKLTPHLYDIITPLLNDIAQTKGAQSAMEQDIMEKVFSSKSLAAKVDLTQGTDAFSSLMNDAEFQEILKLAYLKVRSKLFDVINIDAETIPKIFAFAKACINTAKLEDAELLAGIESETNSEFWQQQDLEGLLTDLEFFRSTVCRRVRAM